LHRELGYTSDNDCLQLLGNGHVVSGSSVVFAKLFEGEFSNGLTLLLASNESPLSDFDHFKFTRALISELVPEILDVINCVRGSNGVVETIHAHCVEQSVVNRAKVDDVTRLVNHVDERHEKESLKTI